MPKQKTNCINCGGPLKPGYQQCVYCGTMTDDEKQNPFTSIFKNRQFRVKALYPILLALGILIAIYIYGFAFDSFSETQLVSITPLWFFFIVFGGYGYFAESMMKRIVEKGEQNLSQAYKKWVGGFLHAHLFLGLMAVIILSPFAFIKTRNSLLIAFAGSAMWGILLLIFFQAIFPAL